MSRLPVYAQLVRLPALPTALADIGLGALATHSLPGRWLPFVLLLAASGSLYLAGMVLNDYFDLEQDRKERPFRPLPSGRVSPFAAALLGTVLLNAGVLFALLAGLALPAGDPGRAGLPPLLALGLVAAIGLYDARLKRTAAGPLAMGTCRFLNVLLGMSVSGALGGPALLLALVVGIYIVGVTWFARTEAQVSNPAALRGAAGVMLAGLVLALPLPAYLPAGQGSPLFVPLLVVLGFLVGLPVCRAIAVPSPARVQAAVKRSLLGLVVLDAVLATALAGAVGLVLLVLLAPSLYLNRKKWLYAT